MLENGYSIPPLHLKFPLTAKQNKLYQLLRNFVSSKGYSPTHRDLAKLYGCSANNVSKMLRIIRDKGYVAYEPASKKGIIVL